MSRFNEIAEKAKQRMDAAPYSPHIVYAEIFFMTDSELEEFERLRRYQIELEGTATDAADRLALKFAKRKGLRHG